MTAAQQRRAEKRAKTWKLETVGSFEEAEAQTRAHWHAASPAERMQALCLLRHIAYGQEATAARLQRVLEIVPGP